MDNDQITTLAREYAEDLTRRIHKMDGELPNCLLKEALSVAKGDAEDVIRFLLRRYCLVEKSKVENMHKGILVQLDPKNFGYSPYNQGRIDLLKSLFPEIAKEVGNDA